MFLLSRRFRNQCHFCYVWLFLLSSLWFIGFRLYKCCHHYHHHHHYHVMNKKSVICIGFNCNRIKLWIKCGFSNCSFAELWHAKYFSGRVALFLTKWGRENVHLGRENSDFTKVSVNSHASQKLTSDISKFCHLCNELMVQQRTKDILLSSLSIQVFFTILLKSGNHRRCLSKAA